MTTVNKIMISGKNARIFVNNKEIKTTGTWTINGYIPWYKVPILWIGKMFKLLKFYV